MPAILNHTPRSAKVFQVGGLLFDNLNELDNLIYLMNEERSKGTVGEDINISNIFPSIKNEIKTNLIEIVKYFMFFGTGRGNANNPVNSILEIYDPSNIDKWKFVNCENENDKIKYIETLYDKLILSMRDKGMPTKKNIQCDPWIFHQKNNGKQKEKYKGSLHIRIKK